MSMKPSALASGVAPTTAGDPTAARPSIKLMLPSGFSLKLEITAPEACATQKKERSGATTIQQALVGLAGPVVRLGPVRTSCERGVNEPLAVSSQVETDAV